MRRSLGGWIVATITDSVTVSIVAAFVLGGVVLALGGHNPFEAYWDMSLGATTGPGLVGTFQRGIPLVGLGLAFAIAFRAGAFNLGVQGQMVIGALAGAGVALFTPDRGVLTTVLAALAACAAGALWALIPSMLYRFLGTSILISSLLLNYPATAVVSYLVRFVIKDPTTDQVATAQIPDGVQVGALASPASGFGVFLDRTLGRTNQLALLLHNLNWSLFIVAALVALTVFVNARTVYGFESDVTGQNIKFARYVGVDSNRVVVAGMLTSGAISGLVGVLLVLGSDLRLIDGALTGTNYAWTALLIALLAANRPLRVVAAGLFFAGLIVGGEAIERNLGVSAQISDIIQALVIVLIALRVMIPFLKRRTKEAEGSVPPDAAESHSTANEYVGTP
jgi:simple sugar transport system permease protein